MKVIAVIGGTGNLGRALAPARNKYYSVDGAGIRVSGELSEPAAA
jgi:predicted dinucleotide-binding enzyme